MHGRPAGGRGPTSLFGPATDDSPGQARLNAVREQGRVVDFTWAFVDDAAAHLLHRADRFLLGKGLRANVGGPLGNPVLIDRYRRVLEHGNSQSFEQVHLVDGRQDIVVHRVARVGDGVEVILTNRGAARRACADALESPLHAMSPQRLSG